jgi:hypothetical protein
MSELVEMAAAIMRRPFGKKGTAHDKILPCNPVGMSQKYDQQNN